MNDWLGFRRRCRRGLRPILVGSVGMGDFGQTAASAGRKRSQQSGGQSHGAYSAYRFHFETFLFGSNDLFALKELVLKSS